jgi:hypothetical protein
VKNSILYFKPYNRSRSTQKNLFNIFLTWIQFSMNFGTNWTIWIYSNDSKQNRKRLDSHVGRIPALGSLAQPTETVRSQQRAHGTNRFPGPRGPSRPDGAARSAVVTARRPRVRRRGGAASRRRGGAEPAAQALASSGIPAGLHHTAGNPS